MEYAIDIMIGSREDLKSEICKDDAQIIKEINIGSGVLLKPQFTCAYTNRAIGGGFEILPFVLSIPMGVATGLAANILYSWLFKNNVNRIIIENKIIILTDEDANTNSHRIKELLREK
jgi:hypothetical protein